MTKTWLAAALALGLAAPAAAADRSEENRTWIDGHKQLSELHEKAAECLEEKSLDECRAEISRDCPAQYGDCATVFDSVSSGVMRDAVGEPASTDGSLPSDGSIPSDGSDMSTPTSPESGEPLQR